MVPQITSGLEVGNMTGGGGGGGEEDVGGGVLVDCC